MERPATPSELYHALWEEVAEARPVLTGDIFAGVDIVDFDGSHREETVMVLDHPCSLRLDGVTLAPRLSVAQVRPYAAANQWRGCFDRMLLPSLQLDGVAQPHSAAHFDTTFPVSPDQLGRGQRIACLTPVGINLLLQRRVHYFSRLVVPTFTFQEVNEHIYEEVDLTEEWRWLREEEGMPVFEAAAECVKWLREEESGTRRQDRLKEAQQRSTIRREMRAYIKSTRPRSFGAP
jgi:hypothetical protein